MMNDLPTRPTLPRSLIRGSVYSDEYLRRRTQIRLDVENVLHHGIGSVEVMRENGTTDQYGPGDLWDSITKDVDTEDLAALLGGVRYGMLPPRAVGVFLPIIDSWINEQARRFANHAADVHLIEAGYTP